MYYNIRSIEIVPSSEQKEEKVYECRRIFYDDKSTDDYSNFNGFKDTISSSRRIDYVVDYKRDIKTILRKFM